MNHSQVFIIGGGLAGLASGLFLAKKGIQITLVEKKDYPFHRVCGEYISNEVLPFLKELGLEPEDWGAAQIKNLEITSTRGGLLSHRLGLGGFGISRYFLDQRLMGELKNRGAEIITETKITHVEYQDHRFLLKDSSGKHYSANLVIGAFGKRSNLDQILSRPFFKKRSPFLGVKYHLKWEMAQDLIQLHNFQGGYAGISAIEKDIFCFCYLSRTENLKKHGSLKNMESAVLKKNPYLKNILENAEFIWDKPQVIHEISFSPKELIHNHILMAGDSAGLISPLCGNGMAIALHSGKLVGESILEWIDRGMISSERTLLERKYVQNWNKQFRTRLWIGRQIQKVFGEDLITHYTLGFLSRLPALTQVLIDSTHGDIF